jgi:hypothetical protein
MSCEVVVGGTDTAQDDDHKRGGGGCSYGLGKEVSDSINKENSLTCRGDITFSR